MKRTRRLSLDFDNPENDEVGPPAVADTLTSQVVAAGYSQPADTVTSRAIKKALEREIERNRLEAFGDFDLESMEEN